MFPLSSEEQLTTSFQIQKMENISSDQFLRLTTCKDIDEIFAGLNTSFFESLNTTREAYFAKLCPAKPYLGPQGLKKWLVTIILIIFLLFGLIGNTLSATIMYRRARRGLSSYFYLALLALVDICVLYSSCLLFMFEITFNYHPQLQAPIFCRFGYYIQHLFTYISAWLIVAVTFERFIVVRFPFQSILVCRMRVAYAITLIIFIVFSLYTAHCFFTLDILPFPLQTDQGYHPDYVICDLIVHQPLFAFLDLCFYSVGPSLLIIIFNILIISTMFHAIKQRKYYLQAESTPAGRSFPPHARIYHPAVNKNAFQPKPQQLALDSTSATGIRLTCLLLIISFIFVLCTSPISIQFLIANFFHGHQSTARWQFFRLCSTLLMYLNHTVNFVFYCLTGRAFRNECRKILCGVWALKDIHISCTFNPHADKHPHYHQQMVLFDRNRIIHSPQQRMKRSYL